MSASDELTADMPSVFGSEVAWAMGGVEAERDWDRSSPEKFVQKIDPNTGLGVWSLVVADPASQTQRKVKILCDDEPVIPEPTGEMPFVPVEFVGLTVRPWLNDHGCKPDPKRRRCGCRVELSVRARGVRPIRPARPSPAASPARVRIGDPVMRPRSSQGRGTRPVAAGPAPGLPFPTCPQAGLRGERRQRVMTSQRNDHSTHHAVVHGGFGPTDPAAFAVVERVDAALSALMIQYFDLTAQRPSTDEGWSRRCAGIALNSARRAGWWRVLIAHHDRHGGLHSAFYRAALSALTRERADARFWRDTAADYRARAEGRPTSDVAGALSNRHEWGVTA